MDSKESELGGSKPDPPNFFILCLQWGLAAFQWGSNPHNPPPIFTHGLWLRLPSGWLLRTGISSAEPYSRSEYYIYLYCILTDKIDSWNAQLIRVSNDRQTRSPLNSHPAGGLHMERQVVLMAAGTVTYVRHVDINNETCMRRLHNAQVVNFVVSGPRRLSDWHTQWRAGLDKTAPLKFAPELRKELCQILSHLKKILLPSERGLNFQQSRVIVPPDLKHVATLPCEMHNAKLWQIIQKIW